MKRVLSLLVALALAPTVALAQKPPINGVAGPNTSGHPHDIVNVLQYGADPTGKTSSTRAFRNWWIDVCRHKRGTGYVPQGTYRIDGSTTLQFDLKDCPMGVSVSSSSMGNTVLDGTSSTANPPFFIGGTGGTSSAPTLTNYSSFVGLTFRGDLAGPTLQLGRNGTGVGLADALDSMEFRNIISTNACSSLSSDCAGVEINNVVSSSFINVAFNAGIQPASKNVTNAVSGNGGVCRLSVSSTTPFAVNQTVFVSGILGATACNGTYYISSIDGGAGWIELGGSTFAGSYTSGGSAGYFLFHGDAVRMQAGSFNKFVGSIGNSSIAVHYTHRTGASGTPFGNTWDNIDIEGVANGVVRDIATGPETFTGGEWAVWGQGYFVKSTPGLTTGFLAVNNPNIGSPNGQAKLVDPSNSSYVCLTGFYSNGCSPGGASDANGANITTSGQFGKWSLGFNGAAEFGFGLNNIDTGSSLQTYLSFLRNGASIGTLAGTSTGLTLGLPGTNTLQFGNAGGSLTLGAGGDWTASTTLRANTGFSANGTAGASATVTVRNSAGTGTCDLVFTFGLFTGTTC